MTVFGVRPQTRADRKPHERPIKLNILSAAFVIAMFKVLHFKRLFQHATNYINLAH